MLRAAAFLDGERIGHVATSSYFIRPTRFDLPIVSLGMRPGDFSTVHNNSDARGRPSERESHIEIFNREGERQVATGMGMRLHGGAGRGGTASIKKSYKVYFRGSYGDKKLHFPLMADTELEVFDKLILRGNFNDGFRTGQQASLIRDQVIRDLHEDFGAVVSHGDWYNLFVNGAYRGVYNIVERMDKSFFESYFPEFEEPWEVVKTGDDILDGGPLTAADWRSMQAYLRSNFRDEDYWERVNELIDVENYTGYMILNIWAQNQDWPHNNWYAARPPGGRWIFLSWDAEFGLGRVPGGFSSDTFQHVMTSGAGLAGMMQGMLRLQDYQKYFLEELDRYLEGPLSPESVLAHVDRVRDIVAPDIGEEAALPPPSGGFARSTWDRNINDIRTFAQRRPAVIRQFVLRNGTFTIPRVTSVSPTRITHSGDEIVRLGGRGFRDGIKVFFNGVESPELFPDRSTRMEARVPYDVRVAGKPVISIEIPDVESLDAVGLLTVSFDAPDLLSVIPESGSAAGGQEVVVVGRDFDETTVVEFGDIRVEEVNFINDTTLRVITPPSVPGTVPMRVVTTRPGELPSDEDVTFTFEPTGGEVAFRRGDVDGDGSINVSDAVDALGYLFRGAGGEGVSRFARCRRFWQRRSHRSAATSESSFPRRGRAPWAVSELRVRSVRGRSGAVSGGVRELRLRHCAGVDGIGRGRCRRGRKQGHSTRADFGDQS